MEDSTVRRLTKKVFPHLWVRHKLMSSVPSTGIFPFSEMTVFSQGIGNAVIVYLHMYRPTLSNYLEKHIPSMTQSKIQFWTHVAFLCLQVRLTNDDVFDYFLTTCAITAEVALHCYMNGYDDVLSLASVFFCAFFENKLYEGFHESGGWDGLLQYIEETSCKELYELVDCYIKDLGSPSDNLPILITVQLEQLAAARREKITFLNSLRIGEIERDDETNKLVSGIFHWHFMENHRMSEAKTGILKRTENVRYKNGKLKTSMNEKRRSESSGTDKELDADIKISNVVELQCLYGDVQSSESVGTISETRFINKAIQTLDDSKYTKVGKENKNPLCTDNKTSEKAKLGSSSSLRELRNFYESLSSQSERNDNDSKYFRSNNGTRNGLESSTINELSNRSKKINHFERNTRSVPILSENKSISPKGKNFTPETVVKSTEPFHDDVLSELTKSFQDLGFKCLSVENLSHFDEKSTNFTNYTEVMQNCQYFKNKYPLMQFVILIPNSFTDKTSCAAGTEKCEDILSKNKDNEQKFSKMTKDFNNCVVSSEKPYSENEKTSYEASKDDKNQFRLANKLALSQNYASENNHKSRFVVTKVNENDLSTLGNTTKISRFSVSKVNENQIIFKDETNLLKVKCANEPTTVSRFTVTKVNENQSKNETSVLAKNWTNETTKISRFTITKVNENQSENGTSILGKQWENETTQISRFTVTKVNENQTVDRTNILRRNWKNETTKISRFTVRKIDENHLTSQVGMSKSYQTNTPELSRFAVTRVDGNQAIVKNRNHSMPGEVSGVAENESVHFQDNGSVKYHKRVSFAEHHFISYYPTYSSDESSNSITSRDSVNQNPPEDLRSSRNSGPDSKPDGSSSTPVPRNPLVSERRKFFQRFSSGESQSSYHNTGRSNTSSRSGIFNRIFRRPNSSDSKVDEISSEKREK